LPLREVFIRDDGHGRTCYTRHLFRSENKPWIITTLAGPAAEQQEFDDAPEDGDLRVIEEMVKQVGWSATEWNDSVLEEYRAVARRFVIDKRQAITIVAEELLRMCELSGRELAAVLSSANGPRLNKVVMLPCSALPSHLDLDDELRR
jgi:hypothetical protein